MTRTATLAGALLVIGVGGGSAATNLYGPPIYGDWTPAWSRNGEIAFYRSARAAKSGIYVVSARGGTPRRVVRDGDEPAWTRTGRLTFVRDFPAPRTACDRPNRPCWRGEIMVDQSHRARALTKTHVSEHAPAWSPGGRYVAFEAYRPGLNSDIGILSADGRRRRLVTRGPAYDTEPSWSPSGRRLVFGRITPQGEWTDLHVTNGAGTKFRNLTRTSSRDEMSPAWSPRDDTIAYERDGVIWLIRANGSGRRRLTAGTAPAWSPDGVYLVVSRVTEGLWIIRRDGSELRRLTAPDD